jgi:hypothetical protein
MELIWIHIKVYPIFLLLNYRSDIIYLQQKHLICGPRCWTNPNPHLFQHSHCCAIFMRFWYLNSLISIKTNLFSISLIIVNEDYSMLIVFLNFKYTNSESIEWLWCMKFVKNIKNMIRKSFKPLFMSNFPINCFSSIYERSNISIYYIQNLSQIIIYSLSGCRLKIHVWTSIKHS